MPDLSVTVLADRPLVRITDVRCIPAGPVPGPQERVTGARLILPRRGVFRWHRPARTVTAGPGSALLVGPGTGYRVSHPAGGDECTVLAPAPALLDPDRADRAGRVPVGHLLAPAAQYRLRLLRAVLRAAPTNRADPDALLVDEAAAGLLGEVLADRALSDRVPASVRTPAVRDAEELLAADPGSRAGLAEIAAAVHASPYHLARTFRAATGLSLHQYRLRLRLAVALDRLADGADDLAALAGELGFAGHSHFTAVFRRAVGRPPGTVRAGLTRPRASELRTILTAGAGRAT